MLVVTGPTCGAREADTDQIIDMTDVWRWPQVESHVILLLTSSDNGDITESSSLQINSRHLSPLSRLLGNPLIICMSSFNIAISSLISSNHQHSTFSSLLSASSCLGALTDGIIETEN